MKDRIVKIREAFNLNQEQFGKRLGITRSSVSGFESGRRSPSDQTRTSICREFGINRRWLDDGIGDMMAEAPGSDLDALATKYGLSDSACVLIEKFINLKHEHQEAVVDFILDAAAAINGSDIDLVPSRDAGPDVAAAEAAYEEALGIAPSGSSSVSNITDGTGDVKKEA